MAIRVMKREDLDDVNQLHEYIFHQSFNFEDYVKNQAFHYAIVIEEQKHIIGYLVGQMVFEMSDLYYVAVNEEYRGRGYAKQLVNQFIKDALKSPGDQMCLEVRKSNQAAIHLYECCQFKGIGLRKNYYADGEDAWLMSRNFIEE